MMGWWVGSHRRESVRACVRVVTVDDRDSTSSPTQLKYQNPPYLSVGGAVYTVASSDHTYLVGEA